MSSLSIWFAEDIRNALMAADEASTATAKICEAVGGDGVTLRAYLVGYRAALTTVALGFGLSPNIITASQEPTQIEAWPMTMPGKVTVLPPLNK